MEDTESYAKTTLGHLEKPEVQGLSWDCVSDEFISKFEGLLKLAEDLKPTRRNLLRNTSSFFDLLGVLSPVLVQMKVLFQMLCQERFDWDAPLPEAAWREWMRWLQDLQEMQRVLVPRRVYAGLEDEIVSCTIHGFGDASEKAYCAVVYLFLDASSGHHRFCSHPKPEWHIYQGNLSLDLSCCRSDPSKTSVFSERNIGAKDSN